MKKIITVDGNEACAYTSYMFTEVAGIYPITPSSPMAEHMDEWSSKNKKNIMGDSVKVVEMQSEAGAAGFIHGVLQSGTLATTFTASQGLLLMIPNMYKMSGEMLPCVMHVAARSLSTHALSIFGDHQDIYATRATGFCMLASSSVQDATYMSGVAHLSAIEASLPFMHFFDGFRTSHEIHKIEVLEQSDYEKLLNKEALKNFRNRALNPRKPVSRGTAENDDIYFQATEVRNTFYNKVPDIVNNYMEKINDIAGTNYKPFNYYGSKNAKYIIVAMGSVCETIKETIDALDSDYGLIEVHLYRPFSKEYFLNVLPESVERIAVLDRTKEAGSIGEPLYLDVMAILKDKNIEIVGGRYGLSSKNTTPRQIKAVYDMLKKRPRHNFTIGIKDDVTNLSLEVDEKFKLSNHSEFLIYGYGSDGMVSAGKSLIKLLGNNTEKDVQGYFEYDSKKSGGITVGHLRFSDRKIRSTYYVENPSIVVVTKESYLEELSILENIQENVTLLINTAKTKEEIFNVMNYDNYINIKNKNIKVYLVRAEELARKVGLQNKISMIMEVALLSISKLIDIEFATSELKKYVLSKFSKKGEEIVTRNYNAIDETMNYVEEVTIDIEKDKEEKIELNSIYEMVKNRKGNNLPTSAFLSSADGTMEAGTANHDKRKISSIVPKWISENCIQCNQCSFVCPHGVIRPFLLSIEEYNKAPIYIQKRCIKPIMKQYEEYYYCIGISLSDCTGCGLCMKKCPGKKQSKALISEKLETQILEKEQEMFDYLSKNISTKKEVDINTVTGSQFKQPKFAFCGACAGCGEPSYIRILTQLFGEELVIANATGCSSIYGGSMPSMPYTVPWSSSLFEDNAEYGYGMKIASLYTRKKIERIMEENMDNPNNKWFKMWLENKDNYAITKEVYDNLDDKTLPTELISLKDDLLKKSVWMIGGDGWAYDIGFSGIDHVLASNDNINILVLDTQVYSNTGGQSSKSTPKGGIASFATNGKNTSKKDLARIALSYPNCYVAQVNLSANMNQLIKVYKEAENYPGPSIIIAYSPCISHGIAGGMGNSLEVGDLATKSGYFPIFHYNPSEGAFHIDCKPDFEKYEEFLNTQTRFKMLKVVNKENAENLLKQNKEEATKRFEYYESLTKK